MTCLAIRSLSSPDTKNPSYLVMRNQSTRSMRSLNMKSTKNQYMRNTRSMRRLFLVTRNLRRFTSRWHRQLLPHLPHLPR